MAAPRGNQNAAKGKAWHDALRKALAQYESKDRQVERGQALFHIANKVVEQALDGDKDARIEIGNRLDGKPHQSMDIGVTDNRSADELTNDELASIAAGSSENPSQATGSGSKPPEVH